MFDINTAINTAIAAAVAEATKPLIERITTLETKLAEAALFERTTEVTVPVDEAKLAEALNSQEWFWEEISRYITDNIKQRLSDAEDRLDKITTASDERIQGMVEQAIDTHLEQANHLDEDYVNSLIETAIENHEENRQLDELLVERLVRETLRSASISIDF